jgi:hypothetical protein
MNLSLRIILLGGFLTLAGCASPTPTFGDRVLQDGQSTVKIAEQWKEGKAQSLKGEKLVANGRKQVTEGRTYLREGEQLVTSGNLKVQMNRQAYQTLSQTTTGIENSQYVAKRVSKLEDIADAWEDAEDDIADGNKLIKRGNEDITEGQADIDAGQKLMELGRSKMEAAESLYQNKG